MKKLDIMNNVSRKFHKAGFIVKKHSPEILVAVGVVGTVASAVMACKATLKVNEVTDETKRNLDKIHEAIHNGCTEAGEAYTVEDSKKDLTIVYAQTGVKFVKLYGPAIAMGALSITSILAGHNILRKRNVALAAAYATVDNSFKTYRNRLIDRFGKELDRELKYDIKAKEIEETVVQEDGTETTVKKTIQVAGSELASPYAIIFDDGCKGWTKDPEVNKFTLLQVQNWANEKLQAKGYLFLNDVYEMLGIPKTKAGHHVGWVYDTKHPNGDNYVDFGLFDIYSERKAAFVNGYERNVIVDFNVDGDIYDLVF